MTADDYLPRGDDICPIHGLGDHALCWDTHLDLADVGPMIALHDAALAVGGEET